MVRPPPISTRFPYTTLFRSRRWRAGVRRHPALEAEAYVRVEGDQTRHREGSEPEAGHQCVADPHDPCNGPPPGRLRARILLLAVQELLVEPVSLLLPAVDDFGVALQGVQVGVAQYLLDEAHVTACDLEESRGRRVAGDVRRFERPGAELLADLLDDVARSRRREASLAVITSGAVEVDEHGHARIGPRRQVVLHRLPRVGREVDASLLGTFSGHHEAISRAREIRAVETERFGDAAPGADQELHERAIALFQ